MIGEKVSHYEILEHLGGGAMGVVYRAEDTRLRRQVALKFLPADLTDDPQATARFLREARAASTLDHPNICTVYEIGRDDEGRHFIVMPFYKGETLQKKLDRGLLDRDQALDFALQTVSGLAHAHDHGVIHRDVKPANLMITDNDEVKIVDFGLARLRGARSLTRTGSSLGTAAYMAPEQVQGAEVGHEADLWSFGVVFHEMVLGRRPFQGDTEPALLYAVVHTEPEPWNREVPRPIGAILKRCLAKDPANRHASAADLGADLNAARSLLSPEGGGGTTHRTTSGPPWSRRLVVLASVIALIGLLSLPALRSAFLGLFSEESPPRGIAVLPFTVAQGDENRRAFADGLSWMLAARLADLESENGEFWIVPQHLINTYEVRDGDAARLRLGVDHTLRGELRFQAGALSLSLQSYDAAEGVPQGRDIRDDLANLETWQILLPRAAAALLEIPISQSPPLDRPGCTTVPGAFLDMITGLGHLHPTHGDPDYATAAEYFRSAVSRDSSFANAYTGLGRSLWKLGGEEDSLVAAEAASYLRRAASLDCRQAWPLSYLAEIESRWWDHTDAITTLEHALAVDPRHAWALDRLASIHARNDDADAAEAAFLRAVQARPQCAEVHKKLGFFYYHAGRYGEAAERLRKTVEITPNHNSVYNALGAVYFELERYDEAQRMFETALTLQPSYGAYSNLGSLYFYRGRFGDAITMFRNSLEFYDGDHSVWGSLAESYYWAPGLRDSATTVYSRAIALAEAALRKTPYDNFALADLASYHARIEEGGRALELIARLEEEDDVSPEVMFIAADVYEQLGHRDHALDWLEKACAADLSLAKVEFYPGLRELRTHPRYRDIVARYGD